MICCHYKEDLEHEDIGKGQYRTRVDVKIDQTHTLVPVYMKM